MVKNNNKVAINSSDCSKDDNCLDNENQTLIMSQKEIFDSLGRIDKVTSQDACRIKATLAYQECARIKLYEELAQVKLRLAIAKDEAAQLKNENTKLRTTLNKFESTISSNSCSDDDIIPSTLSSLSNSSLQGENDSNPNLNDICKPKQDDSKSDEATGKSSFKRIKTDRFRFDPTPYPNIMDGPRYCKLLNKYPWLQLDKDTNTLQCTWCNWHRNKAIRSFTPKNYMKPTETLNKSLDRQRRQYIAACLINAFRVHSMGLSHNEAREAYNKLHNTKFEAPFVPSRSKREIKAVINAYEHDHLYCSVSKQSTSEEESDVISN